LNIKHILARTQIFKISLKQLACRLLLENMGGELSNSKTGGQSLQGSNKEKIKKAGFKDV